MSEGKPRIAIVGTGISGLTCAHYLQEHAELTLFEAGSYVGGHVNTIDYTDSAGEQFPVDTGFIVFNKKTYPNFLKLITDLGVAYQESDMSFSVKAPNAHLEYSGINLNGFFCQRFNILRPKFLWMFREIKRFNKQAKKITVDDARSLGEYLDHFKFSDWFKRHYIVPMGSAIWSGSTKQVLNMPALFFIKFFENHGMLSITEQPQWYTISNGSRSYVQALIKPFEDKIKLNTPIKSIARKEQVIEIIHKDGTDTFDKVICACHADTALALLEDPNEIEREILPQFPYSKNEALVHIDSNIMPKHKNAWASWNYHIGNEDVNQPATLTYYMNKLQKLPTDETVLVTLNDTENVDPKLVKKRINYHHPIFNTDVLSYQSRHNEISGKDRIYYCGAYWRNGFHEDGCFSGIQVCKQLGVDASC